MKETWRHLGFTKAGEHTVLLTTRRSVLNPMVLLSIRPVHCSKIYRGFLRPGAMLFRDMDTGEDVSESLQGRIEEFVARRLGQG